jgi:hypothetical protein
VHLVGFTIGIYYDARTYERQSLWSSVHYIGRPSSSVILFYFILYCTPSWKDMEPRVHELIEILSKHFAFRHWGVTKKISERLSCSIFEPSTPEYKYCCTVTSTPDFPVLAFCFKTLNESRRTIFITVIFHRLLIAVLYSLLALCTFVAVTNVQWRS